MKVPGGGGRIGVAREVQLERGVRQVAGAGCGQAEGRGEVADVAQFWGRGTDEDRPPGHVPEVGALWPRAADAPALAPAGCRTVRGALPLLQRSPHQCTFSSRNTLQQGLHCRQLPLRKHWHWRAVVRQAVPFCRCNICACALQAETRVELCGGGSMATPSAAGAPALAGAGRCTLLQGSGFRVLWPCLG